MQKHSIHNNLVNAENGGASPEGRRRFTIGSVRDLGRRRLSTLAAPPKLTISPAEMERGEGVPPHPSNHLPPLQKSPRVKPFVPTLPTRSLEDEDPIRRRTSSFGGTTPREQAILTMRNARLAAAVNKADPHYVKETTSSINHHHNTNPVHNHYIHPLGRRSSLTNKLNSTEKKEKPQQVQQNQQAAENMWNKQFQELFDSVTPSYCRLSTICEQQTVLPETKTPRLTKQDSVRSNNGKTEPSLEDGMALLSVADGNERVVSPGNGTLPPTVISETTPITMVGSVSCSEEFRKTFDELFPAPAVDEAVRRSIEAEHYENVNSPRSTKETPRTISKRAPRRSSQVHFGPTRYP